MMGSSAARTAIYAWTTSAPVTTGFVESPFGPEQVGYKGFVGGFVVAVVAAYLPDLDHEGSTAGRAVGKFGSRIVRVVLGGHRMGTHSLLAVIAVWFAAAYLYDSPVLASAAAVGMLAHIFTDILTVQGVAFGWPFGWILIVIAWVGNRLGLALKLPTVTWMLLTIADILTWLGKIVNAKTRIGWMITGSPQEKSYLRLVNIAWALTVVYYAYLFYPTVKAWIILEATA